MSDVESYAQEEKEKDDSTRTVFAWAYLLCGDGGAGAILHGKTIGRGDKLNSYFVVA